MHRWRLRIRWGIGLGQLSPHHRLYLGGSGRGLRLLLLLWLALLLPLLSHVWLLFHHKGFDLFSLSVTRRYPLAGGWMRSLR